MKEKFMITIESFHCADRGIQNNVSAKVQVLRIIAVKQNKGIFVLCVNWCRYNFFMLENMGQNN
jgi:hypothetical protein